MQGSFAEAAEQLGLRCETTSGLLHLPFVHGEVDGQKVRARWGDRGSPVEALIEPPLDLGLDVRGRGFVPRMSLTRRIWLEDSNWDMEVDALCDEPSRGAVLFASDARRAVLGLNATNAEIEVRDGSVGVFVMQVDAEALVRALRAVARTAELIAKARGAVPPAEKLAEHAAALRRFARENHLGAMDTPLAAWGDLRTVRLQASFERTGHREHDACVRIAPLEGRLGSGLLVKRETAADRVRKFFGGQDIQTGDAAFDPAFLVQAHEAERAVTALDDDVRALLLELRGRFDAVTLDDGGITLRGPAARVPPNEIANLLEAACAVVERVARASTAVSMGPYR